MKEYGGYIQLDSSTGQEYYQGPQILALNSGRTALRFLIRAREIKNLLIPSFCCDTVREACEAEGISWEYYATGPDLRPILTGREKPGQWLYLVNLYGILDDAKIRSIHKKYPQMIADYTHAFFQQPLPDVDTLYSCRKFFGVADGAYISLKQTEDDRASFIFSMYQSLPLDASHDRMHFLLGRYEGAASDFYEEYAENNEIFSQEPIKQMSPLTHNLLRAVDYEMVCSRRSQNFHYLNERLAPFNRLTLPDIPGAYAYPFWPKETLPLGTDLRREMIRQKVYVPCLWPDVKENALEEEIAQNILPLPVDQRYVDGDMEEILRRLAEGWGKGM